MTGVQRFGVICFHLQRPLKHSRDENFQVSHLIIDGNRGVKRCNTMLAYSMIHTKKIVVYIGKSVLKLLAFGHFIYVS